MPFEAGSCSFSTSGLTVGRTGASGPLGDSPEMRTFSSPIVADLKMRYYSWKKEKSAIAMKERGQIDVGNERMTDSRMAVENIFCVGEVQRRRREGAAFAMGVVDVGLGRKKCREAGCKGAAGVEWI